MVYFTVIVGKDPVGKGTVDLENVNIGVTSSRMGSKLTLQGEKKMVERCL
jgi:predicted ATPase